MKGFVQLLMSWGPAGVFVLAVLDSAGIPLPAAVDALVVATAAVNPGAAFLAALVAIAGSLIGSMALYYVGRRGGQAYLNRVAESSWASNARESFLDYGLITVFVPALLPIPLPLKVFVVSAGVFGVRPGAFLATMAAARIPRYLGLAWLGSQLGHEAMGWLKGHVWQIGLLALVLATALFVAARTKAARMPRAGA